MMVAWCSCDGSTPVEHDKNLCCLMYAVGCCNQLAAGQAYMCKVTSMLTEVAQYRYSTGMIPLQYRCKAVTVQVQHRCNTATI